MDDTLLLSRIQFAANISFHILFPTINIALCWLLLFFRLRHSATRGTPDEAGWEAAYYFWTKVFALTFALGVVSGITMSFQFGTNWPGYMEKAGNIAGTAPQVVVAGNLGCLVQISRFAEAPVAHLVQLVDWAGGGPAPRGLEDFQPRPAAAPADDGPGLYADTAEAPAQDLSSNQPLW